ncbi:MAG TPA: hypothetical protein VFU23_10675 [Gemmatimonadales bacterium]|nr:hypothetical protein [Gemmatimonadales bacterium]
MTHAFTSLPPVVRALLAGAIDYAGLFPPAELDMGTAVSRYLVHRAGPDAWALGRFVVPSSRLDALAVETRAGAEGLPEGEARLIPLTVLLGADTAGDVEAVETFNRECLVNGARVDAVEVKAATDEVVHRVLEVIPARWVRYVEVPLGEGTPSALDAVRDGGAFAKVRTGGTVAEAIPTPERLIEFLEGVKLRRLAFKATAGLHHPVRGLYRLTGAPDGPLGVTYGYLNLMIAAGILWRGGDRTLAREALLESDIESYTINGDALLWHDLRFEGDAIERMRSAFFHGFGSCSFSEPLRELPAWSGR